MFCQECGSKMDDGAVFCGNCGTKIEAPQVVAINEEVLMTDEVAQENAVIVETQSTPVPQPVPVATPQPVPVATPQPVPVPVQPVTQAVAAPQANYQAPVVDSRDKPMTVLGWIGTMLLMMIPLVQLVLPFVWAFSSETNKSKQAFFRASLILTLVFIILGIVFSTALFAIFAVLFEGMESIYY